MRSVIWSEFGAARPDLVVDDGGRSLEDTRAAFGTLFPFLRPGGTYMIRDWAWADRPGAPQENGGPRPDEPATALLALEVAQLCVSRPDLVESVEITDELIVVHRGETMTVETELALSVDFPAGAGDDIDAGSGTSSRVALAQLRADLAARDARLVDVYASTSWRVSAPVRLAGRLVGGGAGGLRALPRSLALRARHVREAAWLRRRAAERLAACRDFPDPGLLSFITPVWNAPPKYLAALADSIFRQAGDPPFEWVVLDNGSTDGGTIAFLDEKIALHPRVVFHRSSENLGIVGGTRFCLVHAGGRYVLPVDHDDRLYPDCVATVTHWLKRAGYPAVMYSDEDKLLGRRATMPFLKPDWDPVLFADQCYTAHLDVIDRALALGVGAYADEGAEGSPDWDCLMRLHVAGHHPVHLPEVLYSWRMHAASTSFDIDSKSYIQGSQRAVRERYLRHVAHPERFLLELSPQFIGTPDWHVRRLPTEPRPLVFASVGDERPSPAEDELDGYPVSARVRVSREAAPTALLDLLPGVDDEALVALLDARVQVTEPGWVWESLGLVERFPDAVMVGGRLLDEDDRILAAGQVLGFEPGCACPDAGLPSADPGYSVWLHKQRSVSAVSAALCVVTAGFLRDLLRRGVPVGGTWAGLGAWAGAHALREGARVIYSPFVGGRLARAAAAPPQPAEWSLFLAAHGESLPDERWYSRGFGLTSATSYRPVEAEERARQIGELLARAAAARDAASSPPPGERSA